MATRRSCGRGSVLGSASLLSGKGTPREAAEPTFSAGPFPSCDAGASLAQGGPLLPSSGRRGGEAAGSFGGPGVAPCQRGRKFWGARTWQLPKPQPKAGRKVRSDPKWGGGGEGPKVRQAWKSKVDLKSPPFFLASPNAEKTKPGAAAASAGGVFSPHFRAGCSVICALNSAQKTNNTRYQRDFFFFFAMRLVTSNGLLAAIPEFARGYGGGMGRREASRTARPAKPFWKSCALRSRLAPRAMVMPPPRHRAFLVAVVRVCKGALLQPRSWQLFIFPQLPLSAWLGASSWRGPKSPAWGCAAAWGRKGSRSKQRRREGARPRINGIFCSQPAIALISSLLPPPPGFDRLLSMGNWHLFPAPAPKCGEFLFWLCNASRVSPFAWGGGASERKRGAPKVSHTHRAPWSTIWLRMGALPVHAGSPASLPPSVLLARILRPPHPACVVQWEE